MRIANFIICLFLFLSGGLPLAIRQDNGSYQLTQQPVKKQSLTIANNHQQYLVTDVNDPNITGEWLINEEEDDEETNKVLARKCKSLDADNLIFSHLIYPGNTHFCCNATRPFYSLLSNKYISQRTLRI